MREADLANLKDVARLAEVDPSTASRVLSGDPSQQVRPETRDRIVDAARTLRYRPNALARGLRTRRTDTIGVVIPNLGNVGFAEVTQGIQAAAAEAGRLVLLVEADVAGRDDGPGAGGPHAGGAEVYGRLIGDGRLDGLIVAFATLSGHLVAQLAERGIPLVLVNRRTAGVHGSVVVDDERGSAMAVEHLAALGHRRIGYIGLDADTDTALRRERGFRTATARLGMSVDPCWTSGGEPTEDGGSAAVERVLARCPDDLPTGFVVASLLGAIGVLASLRAAGRQVPEQVSLVAFNDHSFAAHTNPPLTTVRMPNFRMGQEAARMLVDALEGKPVRDLMIDEAPQIIVRASTAPPRAS